VVGEGLVKVILTSEQGDEIVLVTLSRFRGVGELSFLDGSPRSASVLAAEPTTVLMLPRSAVPKSMTTHPAVLDAVFRSLGQLVRRLTEQTGGLVSLDLAGQLAGVLIHLADSHAQDDQRMVFDVGLRQSDIAAMVGAHSSRRQRHPAALCVSRTDLWTQPEDRAPGSPRAAPPCRHVTGGSQSMP